MTQSIPDVSLPGQEKHFSGHAQFNPFTHMLGVASNNDFGDSWGAGYALQGNSFIVGAEVDDSKFESHAVALDIPIPGLNEVENKQLFTFEELMKSLVSTHLYDSMISTRYVLIPINSLDRNV
uniref:Beta-lactamase domain-containing protein n=1 Tax=Heterorhabditis bacteriophora TaxID=37862 RepID=A0A1I7XHQ8_HETBA